MIETNQRIIYEIKLYDITSYNTYGRCWLFMPNAYYLLIIYVVVLCDVVKFIILIGLEIRVKLYINPTIIIIYDVQYIYLNTNNNYNLKPWFKEILNWLYFYLWTFDYWLFPSIICGMVQSLFHLGFNNILLQFLIFYSSLYNVHI